MWPEFSGHSGSGGDGLHLGKKLYLLDLVEAGNEKAPYINGHINASPEIQKRIETKLDPVIFPTLYISKKLTEISKIDTLFSLSLIRAIELYNWRLVDSELIDIKDEKSLLKYPLNTLVQLASRSSSTIRIDTNLWKKLDTLNKTALVFHEILYALIKPQYVLDSKTGKYSGIKEQSSSRAREVNGYLFSKDFSKYGIDGLENVTRTDFEIGYGIDRYFEVPFSKSIYFYNQLWLMSGTPEWEKTNYGVRLDSNLEFLKAYSEKACTISVASGAQLKLISSDKVRDIHFKDFNGESGPRTMVEVYEYDSDTVGTYIKNINSLNIHDCKMQVVEALQSRLDELNKNYK